MTTTQSSTTQELTTELSPSYTIPLVLVIAAIPLLLWQPWLALAIALFGCFLMFQTVTLRLVFTPTALDIYRSEQLIRRFPYSQWQNWRIFWQPVPILFYFKEVNSIHFLPIIFNSKSLQSCLEKHFPLDKE